MLYLNLGKVISVPTRWENYFSYKYLGIISTKFSGAIFRYSHNWVLLFMKICLDLIYLGRAPKVIKSMAR